jgi:broad specificity phosphatase PhoE
MKWLLRHSERFLHDDKEWINHSRYTQNKRDMVLTERGIKYIAVKAAEEIMKNDKNIKDMTFIYSSPMTRCIQTSLIVQRIIFKQTKKFIPIRIEYGLCEYSVIYHYLHKTYDKKTNKYILLLDKKEALVLDNQLTLKNIIKQYGKYIDATYKSLYSFKQLQYQEKDHFESANRILKTIQYIMKKEKTNNYIVSSHAIAIINMIPAFTKEILPENISLKINGLNTWCSLTGINHTNKIIYGPSANYY